MTQVVQTHDEHYYMTKLLGYVYEEGNVRERG